MKILFCVLILFGSCSFKKNPLENQILKGHKELYSEPEKPNLEKLDAHEKRIIIASTNDVQGQYQTHSEALKDVANKESQSIKVGGIDVIMNYFEILREVYPNVVLVDSGDIFSKSGSSNTVREFYNELKYDAVTVGLTDFNLKLPMGVNGSAELFQNFAKTSEVPLLLSNLYELKTARTIEWKGTKPYLIKNIDGVKVGIMGMIPDDMVPNTPVNNRVGLYVENMLQSTLRHARLLRSLGAEVIVVLTHQGIDCSSELASQSKIPLMKVNFEPQRPNVCNLRSPLGEYLERLPPGLVDVVVGGRTHQKIANFVNGTLVMASFPEGKAFSFAEFVVDTKTKKIVPAKTVVHQPVTFCHEFFSETDDCFTEDPSVDHKSRTEAIFLGKKIRKIEGRATGPVSGKTSFILKHEDISKSLIQFKSDITYLPKSSGYTQLYVLSMNGRDFIRVLEEDYNGNKKNDWQPNPYLEKDQELMLSVAGLDINPKKDYRILTDIESIQGHTGLIKHLSRNGSEALMNYSWNSIVEGADSVNTRLAAPQHK